MFVAKRSHFKPPPHRASQDEFDSIVRAHEIFISSRQGGGRTIPRFIVGHGMGCDRRRLMDADFDAADQPKQLHRPKRPQSKRTETVRNALDTAESQGKLRIIATRYAIRRDAFGYTVADNFTGRALVFAMPPQTGLSEDDARHLAELFNKRANQGELAIQP